MPIFIASDLHLNQKGIEKSLRPGFKDHKEHDEAVIKAFARAVGKDDRLYILGDLGFAPAKELKPLIKRIPGYKILIVGNHDILTDAEYHDIGIKEVIRHPIYISENVILSHYPLREGFKNRWVINIHGHLHGERLSLGNYVNANIEANGFAPYDLETLKAAAAGCPKSRWQPYGKEWYAPYARPDEGVAGLSDGIIPS